MFLTLTPDSNFKNSGKQEDQVDFISSIPSGLLLRPNTKLALYSGSWKVIEGITIPSGTFSITVMQHTFEVSITAQTFKETPTGSSTTAGSLLQDYLNDKINDTLKAGAVSWHTGLEDNSKLEPAYNRFGSLGNSTSSTLWEWDSTGKDFVYEMKYNTSTDYDTGSTVMVSGTNAEQNFNTNAYTKVIANDLDLGGGNYRYRLRPATGKNTDAWNDAGFCAYGSAFCCDGISNAGKGKYGELVFKWSDQNGGSIAMVGLTKKSFDPTLAQTQKSIVSSIQLTTGSPPVIRELRPDGTVSALTFQNPPPADVSNGNYFRIRMEASDSGDENFTYAVSTDGNTYTPYAFTDATNTRYESKSMNSEEIMPFFKPNSKYDGANLYGVDNMQCTIVPSKSHKSGAGYKWNWSGFPNDISFSPGDLSSVLDIKGFTSDTGAGKSDGGVVSNVNTSASGVYVDIPSLGVKSITGSIERNVIGVLPIGEMADGTNGMGSINGLQYNQVYNMIYHDLNNQEEREHNQMRVRLIDVDGNLLTNISTPAITLCVKPSSN